MRIPSSHLVRPRFRDITYQRQFSSVFNHIGFGSQNLEKPVDSTFAKAIPRRHRWGVDLTVAEDWLRCLELVQNPKDFCKRCNQHSTISKGKAQNRMENKKSPQTCKRDISCIHSEEEGKVPFRISCPPSPLLLNFS